MVLYFFVIFPVLLTFADKVPTLTCDYFNENQKLFVSPSKERINDTLGNNCQNFMNPCSFYFAFTLVDTPSKCTITDIYMEEGVFEVNNMPTMEWECPYGCYFETHACNKTNKDGCEGTSPFISDHKVVILNDNKNYSFIRIKERSSTNFNREIRLYFYGFELTFYHPDWIQSVLDWNEVFTVKDYTLWYLYLESMKVSSSTAEITPDDKYFRNGKLVIHNSFFLDNVYPINWIATSGSTVRIIKSYFLNNSWGVYIEFDLYANIIIRENVFEDNQYGLRLAHRNEFNHLTILGSNNETSIIILEDNEFYNNEVGIKYSTNKFFYGYDPKVYLSFDGCLFSGDLTAILFIFGEVHLLPSADFDVDYHISITNTNFINNKYSLNMYTDHRNMWLFIRSIQVLIDNVDVQNYGLEVSNFFLLYYESGTFVERYDTISLKFDILNSNFVNVDTYSWWGGLFHLYIKTIPNYNVEVNIENTKCDGFQTKEEGAVVSFRYNTYDKQNNNSHILNFVDSEITNSFAKIGGVFSINSFNDILTRANKLDVNVKNTKMNDNRALESGGVFFFLPELNTTLVIEDSTFRNNSAERGGVYYTRSVKKINTTLFHGLYVTYSLFEQNGADFGGVFYIGIEHYILFPGNSRSYLQKNSAILGGAYFFDNEKCSIEDNNLGEMKDNEGGAVFFFNFPTERKPCCAQNNEPFDILTMPVGFYLDGSLQNEFERDQENLKAITCYPKQMKFVDFYNQTIEGIVLYKELEIGIVVFIDYSYSVTRLIMNDNLLFNYSFGVESTTEFSNEDLEIELSINEVKRKAIFINTDIKPKSDYSFTIVVYVFGGGVILIFTLMLAFVVLIVLLYLIRFLLKITKKTVDRYLILYDNNRMINGML